MCDIAHTAWPTQLVEHEQQALVAREAVAPLAPAPRPEDIRDPKAWAAAHSQVDEQTDRRTDDGWTDGRNCSDGCGGRRVARTDPEPVEVVDLETAVAHDVHDAVGKGAHHAEEAVKPTYREAQVAGHKDLATDERLSGDKSEEILHSSSSSAFSLWRSCACACAQNSAGPLSAHSPAAVWKHSCARLRSIPLCGRTAYTALTDSSAQRRRISAPTAARPAEEVGRPRNWLSSSSSSSSLVSESSPGLRVLLGS